MDMDHLIAASIDVSRARWISILRAYLADHSLSEGDCIVLITSVASKLAESASLRESEKEQRLSDLLGMLRFTKTEAFELAEFAQSLLPCLKNAMLRYLPAEMRPFVYGRGQRPSADLCHANLVEENESVASVVVPLASSGIATNERCSGIVLILSKSEDQAANKSLLKEAGFEPPTVDSQETLDTLINEPDVCACIVDSSYLRDLSKEEQETLFRFIASRSSFVWIRVSDSDQHLQLSELQLYDLVRSARCQSNNSGPLVSVQHDDTIRGTETAHIQRAANTIQAGNDLALTPTELTSAQARLLTASVASEVNNYGRALSSSNLHVRFFHDGRTLAKTVYVTLPDSSFPLVAKLDTPRNIADEARRFYEFISPWDRDLNPIIRFHAGNGVMLFRLVSDMGSQSPAPSLEDRLLALWMSDKYPHKDYPGPNEDDLVQAVSHAAEKLSLLNRQKPTDRLQVDCYNRPIVDANKKMWEKGVGWGFDDSAFLSLEQAEIQFQRLDRCAILHGDVHLRNILIRGDRESFLIDYANSGPGHPCVDLVRLELSLYFCAFQQTAGEDRCREFQQALSFNGTQAEELIAAFPDLSAIGVNRVCIRGMVNARIRALEVLAQHGGGLDDYYAVKTLVAWYSLLVSGTQIGLIRSVISALTATTTSAR
jgi:hypothetical protein